MPTILFSYKGWGTSRRSERFPSTTARIIADSESSIKHYAEIALGFVMYGGYQVGRIYHELHLDAFDPLDPESHPVISKKYLFTSWEQMHDY